MLFRDVSVRHVRPLRTVRRLAARGAACVLAAGLLAACGGGGGGNDGAGAAATAGLPPSASLANQCALDDQKRFARSYLDEVYLWWDEVVEVPPAGHSTVAAYVDALRVRPKDRFSAVITSAAADALLQSTAAPLGAALGAAVPLVSPTPSVPLATTLTSPGGRRVGYLLFNDHRRGAQDALVPAFEALRAAAVQDLVLDIRYNTGGYLYVAQAAASMAAGPGQDGQVFEELRYSGKQAAAGLHGVMRFTGRVEVAERQFAAGHALPRLALPRVYVLASGLTCSASESIINSLRGVGIEVVIVGDVTCGKPYGFRRQDNCAQAYFAVEFQGFNARGFGDYTQGFSPQCAVEDDGATPLGSAAEPLLGAALRHIDTGTCPAPTLAPRAASALGIGAGPARPAGLGLEGRLLAP